MKEKKMKSDLAEEGAAIANILAALHALPDHSRDRVLAVVIDLAAPGELSEQRVNVENFTHPGFQAPDNENILANFTKLHHEHGFIRDDGDGDP